MRPLRYSVGLGGLLMVFISACGSDGDRGAAPPIVPGQSKTTFSLENGKYYVEKIRDLQDGCGKKPMEGSEPITSVPFNLTNNGDGTVTMDFCSDKGRSLQGPVRGNRGTLSVIHDNRVIKGTGQHPGEFRQECTMDLIVEADNQFHGRYAEKQTNRNEAMRLATTNVPECTTSFTFTMKRANAPLL